ncbi:MAG: CC0125/CC1285 family lipoprotein [Hyphococcus sp.]
MPKYFLLAAAALCLAACATATPYGPASEGGGYGFTDQRIEENRFRITFRGNSSTRRETVENSLLYRAAELTVDQGYDYFIVVENETERTSSFRGTSYPAFYGAYGFGYPFYRPFYAFPYYAYGFGWGYPYDSYVREIRRYSAVAFVTMHTGDKPDNPNAFTAREVLQNLGPVVLGPPQS